MIAVADHQRERGPEGHPVTESRQHFDLVALEPLPGTATIALASSREVALDCLAVEPKPGGKADRPASTAPGRAVSSVYVSNLPWSTTSDDLERLFGRYGAVSAAKVVVDRRTGRSRGFGFVDMEETAAGQAIGALDGSALGGRDLKVRTARPSVADRELRPRKVVKFPVSPFSRACSAIA